jgi:Domain of unknown function (DUF4129)
MPFSPTLLSVFKPIFLLLWIQTQGVGLWAKPPVHKEIPQAAIEQYQNQEAFQYEEAKIVSNQEKSLWERFVLAIQSFFKSLIGENATDTLNRVLPYILGFIGLIYILYAWGKSQQMGILMADNAQGSLDFVHITQMQPPDFDAKIAAAIQQQQYKEALRWLYLRSLQRLAAKNLIQWKRDKTNRDYLKELEQTPLYPDFKHLTYYFDYAHYGNMPVTAADFAVIQQAFDRFYEKQ